jgi:hypothetical protein
MILLAVGLLLPDFDSGSYTPGICGIPFITLFSLGDRNPWIPGTPVEFIDFAQFLGFLWAAPVVILLQILLIRSESASSKWTLRMLLITSAIMFILAMGTNQYFSITDYTHSQITYYTLFGVLFGEFIILVLERRYRPKTDQG